MEIGTQLHPVRFIELAALLILLATVFLRPSFLLGITRRVSAWLDRFSARPVAPYILLFVLPAAFRLALLPIYPPPHPQAHDELAYMVQAETFADFEATNPPLQRGDPIEQQYVLSRPTRQSVYPPAQALALAAGILLLHSVWAGVLLEMSILCPLLFWSMRQWTPPRWAFRAALYFALFLGVTSYWTNGFFAGPVNAIGGLLMWGAMPRLRRDPKLIDGLLFALGCLIAIDSRPVESILFALLATAWILRPFVQARRGFPLQVIAAAAAVVVLGTLLNLYYDWKVTGNPLEPGYIAQQKAYGVPQNFYFQHPVRCATCDFPDIRNEYLRQLGLWRRGRSVSGFLMAAVGKVRRAWAFYIGVALTPLLFALPGVLRSRGTGVALFFAALFFGIHLLYHSYYPHYEATVLGAIALLLIQAWRGLSIWRGDQPFSGAMICRVLPAVAVIGMVVPLFGRVIGGPPDRYKWYGDEFYYPHEARRMLDRFDEMPGRVLLLVHLSQDHDPDEDWIVNDRDPAASKVVVARDLGEESDRALLRRFPGRQCWQVDADSEPPRAAPCDSFMASGSSPASAGGEAAQ